MKASKEEPLWGVKNTHPRRILNWYNDSYRAELIVSKITVGAEEAVPESLLLGGLGEENFSSCREIEIVELLIGLIVTAQTRTGLATIFRTAGAISRFTAMVALRAIIISHSRY